MDSPVTPISRALATHIRKLSQKKHRAEFQEYILEGVRNVEDVLQSGEKLCFIVLSDSQRESCLNIEKLALSHSVPVYSASEKVFHQISDTKQPQGVLAVAKLPAYHWEFAFTEKPNVICALHEANDPGNLGTIIRTCDWFGVRHLLLSSNSADPFNPKVVRASMGSIVRVQVSTFTSHESLFSVARSNGYTIITADSGKGKSIYELDVTKKALLLFGSEAHGLPETVQSAANISVQIPRYSNAESLNLATSHAIILSELRRQR